MVRSSCNLIQWRKSLFDTVLVYNNKNKPMLRYKFGSVYDRIKIKIFKLRFNCNYGIVVEYNTKARSSIRI